MKFEHGIQPVVPLIRDARVSLRNREECEALNALNSTRTSDAEVGFGFRPTPHGKTLEALRGVRLHHLQPRHIPGIRTLMSSIFTMDAEHASDDIESIAQRNPLSHIEGNHVYWVLEDKHGEILGITGVNDIFEDDPSHTWLGWFAVEKPLQGSAMGIILLEYTMQNARQRGKKQLFILTDNHPSMAQNFKFYQREGCSVVAIFDTDGIHIDGSMHIPSEQVLRELYMECKPHITDGVTWYVRRKGL